MRAFRRHPIVAAVTTALVAVAAVAGPVQAGPAPWLTATPTSSRITLAAGGSVTVTITNTDRRASSSALTVTLARNPSSAPFAIVSDLCAGVILRPGASCTVEVGYFGPPPTTDNTAALTVASGKPMKATVTRVIEVGVTFADVCAARGGSVGYGGTITVSVRCSRSARGATGTQFSLRPYTTPRSRLWPASASTSDIRE